jgi:hypothetical protein
MEYAGRGRGMGKFVKGDIVVILLCENKIHNTITAVINIISS